jgi:Type III flagellar switch regulator (C-ring) FliN C-term
MTLGAPPGRISFPAIDRPSALFLTRFERALRALPDDMLGLPFSAVLGGCVEDGFAACIASLGAVSVFQIVDFGGHRGLIGVPDAVIDGVTEFACGGDGSEPSGDARGATALGLALGARLASALVAALQPVQPAQIIGTTDHPGEAVPVKSGALACGFAVEARGQALGAIGLLIPMRALAAVECGTGRGDDPVWAAQLESAVAQARTPVRAVLARPVLAAGEVARLVPGAVIPIPTMNEIALIAGGFRVATGLADVRDGRAAIRIQRTEFAA